MDFLRNLEKYAFEFVLSGNDNKKIEIKKDYSEVKSILDMVYSYGPTLLVTDHIFENLDMLQVLPDEIDSIKVNLTVL